jgi:hypothetical protein
MFPSPHNYFVIFSLKQWLRVTDQSIRLLTFSGMTGSALPTTSGRGQENIPEFRRQIQEILESKNI